MPSILIVESHSSLVPMLAGRLESAAFRLLSAVGSDAALRMADAEHPQLIIADISSAEIDAADDREEAAVAYQELGLPLILISDTMRCDIIRRSHGPVCQYLVRKPCSIDALMALVHNAVGDHDAPVPATSV